MEYMREVESYLLSLNYNVMFNMETKIYHFEYTATNCNITVFIDFNTSINLLTIYCKRNDIVDEKFYDILIKYFNWSNIRLNVGTFYLDMENGELYFRVAQELYPSVVNPTEVLNVYLHIAIEAMDNYNAGVNALFENKTLEEAYLKVIEDENSYDIFSLK